jgi:hypothetical protein
MACSLSPAIDLHAADVFARVKKSQKSSLSKKSWDKHSQPDEGALLGWLFPRSLGGNISLSRDNN